MKAVTRVLEIVTLDEPHGIERPTIRIGAEAIHGHNAGMLESAGDFRFQHKPAATGVLVRVLPLDLFQRHLSVQLQILRHKYFTEATFRMRAQHSVTDRLRALRESQCLLRWRKTQPLSRQARAAAAIPKASPEHRRRPHVRVLHRTDDVGSHAARLCSTEPCRCTCASSNCSSSRQCSRSSAPRSTRISPSGRSLATAHAFIASTSWSRVTRSFCRAKMPSNRLRSTCWFIVAPAD